MSSPRLLVICHGFLPYHGGAELAAWYLAREAARDGLTVDVLTSDLGGRLPAEERAEGVTIHRVHAPKKEWTRHTAIELGRFYLAARRRLKDFLEPRPDLVLAHFSFPAGLLARRLHRRYGIPYAVVLHGSDVPGYQPERFEWLYPLLKPVVRRVWRDAQQVIAVSKSLRDLALETWPRGTISVIENGVDTGAFSPAASKPPREGSLRVITAAQLIERKGLRFLLMALTERERLTICGTGPQQPELQALAVSLKVQDRVRFAGAVEPEKMPEFFKAADAFVLPSLQEGLPLALLEAMACGLAIVATRVGGIPAVLKDGENALVVDPGNSPQLRTALERLLDPGLRQRLGREARRTAEQHSWNTVWACYKEGLAGPRGESRHPGRPGLDGPEGHRP
jgi:glycogen(starch) synthase